VSTNTYEEAIRGSYELAGELLPRWRKLQADLNHAMLFNQEVHGFEFMRAVIGRREVGMRAGDWVQDNIHELTKLAIHPDKDCPLPIVDRLLGIMEQAGALKLIPPMPGSKARAEAVIRELKESDTSSDAVQWHKSAEEALFKMVEMSVQDLFAVYDLDWVPMPVPGFYYPNGKDAQAKGEIITCDDCNSVECLFNEENANNPAVWVCLAQEVARDRGDDYQDYVIEIEGYGDGFRLVRTWVGCGVAERDVLISVHTAEEFHSELVRLLVGTPGEVNTDTPEFAKEPQPA